MLTTTDLPVSAPAHEIRVMSNLKVPMRDGVKLAADVYLPRGLDSVPVVLTRTPPSPAAQT